MSNKKPFVSLTAKMALAVMIGLGLALCMYGFCSWIENTVVQSKYQSDMAIERNVGDAYESLEQFVYDYHVEASNTTALSDWVKSQEYTYLYVYDNYADVFESGWWVAPSEPSPDAEFDDEDSTLYENIHSTKERRIDKKNFTTDVRNRIVEFADGEFYVYIDVYKEAEWVRIMDIVTLILCFLTLLATILIYNGILLKRIASLSTNIQKVSDGDLSHQVHAVHNDELGALAISVDNMRASIIKKHENEKEAWNANQQLITEMSHDVRTPLTSMIGYLDIIEGEKYSTKEDLAKYVSACRDKAFQLKDLSDKLFQYFLVYGEQEETELEVVDANILFQQLLMEHNAELISYGYVIEFAFDIPEVEVKVDISRMRRLIDNVFSNLRKYADPQMAIKIEARMEENQILIIMKNRVSEDATKVESNKIGLKTCEKICSSHGGKFAYVSGEEYFTSWIYLPVAKGEKTAAAEEEAEE